MNRWEKGRATIDSLISTGRLESVSANRPHAEAMLGQARSHLASAELLATTDDQVMAFTAAYDGARKALTAILANQGLRPRGSEGGHAVVLEAALAQLDPPMGRHLREFAWMRMTRNDSEYPTPERPVASANDVAEAIPATRQIIEIAMSVVAVMPPF
jgi:HEPN domain-containing protein